MATGTAVTSIAQEGKQLLVQASGGFASKTDMALVAVGSRPNVELAQSAGISLGVKGAIQVNRQMQTNVSGVYAAGDCAETYHGLLQKNLYLPLGTTAHKQGHHKVYYPGAEKLNTRLTGDRRTGVLLGAQIAGHFGSEVSKRIDIAAAAIFHRMSVVDPRHLDLSYAPPLSSPWEPIQMAAQEWVRAA